LSQKDAKKLVHAFVTSRLDYCNSLLSGCSNKSLSSLKLIQNAAARVLSKTKKRDHITSPPVLAALHWLPVKSRITFKILLLTYTALIGDVSCNTLSCVSCVLCVLCLDCFIPYTCPQPLLSLIVSFPSPALSHSCLVTV